MHHLPFTLQYRMLELMAGSLRKGAHTYTGDLQPCSLLLASVISNGGRTPSDPKLVSRSPFSVLRVSSVRRDRKGVTEVTAAGGRLDTERGM